VIAKSDATRKSGAEQATCPDDLAPARADQIAYMADMILELKQMAQRAGLGKVAALLDLAHDEAQANRQDVRSRA